MQRLACKLIPIAIISVLVALLYLVNRDASLLEAEEEEINYVLENLQGLPLEGVIHDPSSVPQIDEDDFYGVMFDAGSTGSRVHVFHFRESPPGIPPTLVSEVFNYTKLPLAQYADNPPEGAASLKILLDVALESIPAHKWSSTPVALKATAGLRLIPEEKAQALLAAVYAMFNHSPLHVETPAASVSIMEGTDEGIFMWVTVNFLNGALIGAAPETRGTLDMGGGSTQVTFLPHTQDTLDHPTHRDFIRVHPFLQHNYHLYTKSYLSLGLRAARLEILKMEKENPIFIGSSIQGPSAPEQFTSVCLPPFLSGTWDLGGNTYSVASSNLHSERLYQNCHSVVRAFVEDTVLAPAEIQNRTFYALSYFWERAAEIGLVDWENGGTLLVKDYKNAALNTCTNYKIYPDKPFHCMDMVYLSSILSHGYRFSDDVKLLMNNKIKGYEVSWALGATLDLLRTHWEHARKL